jgi:hypothetical protein
VPDWRDINWGGTVAAWLAGFGALVGAVLAFLVLTAHPWSTWRHIAVDVLVGALVVGLVGYVLTFPAAIIGAGARKRRLRRAEPAPEITAGHSDEPAAEWKVRVSETPGTHELSFVCQHRFDNMSAYMSFSDMRCTVTDPAGITTTVSGEGRAVAYPHHFPNAPAVRPGVYHCRWEGMIRQGAWVEIISDDYEVKAWDAGPALTVRIMEDTQFENWRRIALIAALHVQIKNNTSDKRIRIIGYGFTVDSEGIASWSSQVTSDENIAVIREVARREDTQQYGQPLRHFNHIAPGDTVSGWFVEAVNRPPSGGTPACTIEVKDELENRYQATIEARKAQLFKS